LKYRHLKKKTHFFDEYVFKYIPTVKIGKGKSFGELGETIIYYMREKIKVIEDILIQIEINYYYIQKYDIII
jgi:hypothetical protein